MRQKRWLLLILMLTLFTYLIFRSIFLAPLKDIENIFAIKISHKLIYEEHGIFYSKYLIKIEDEEFSKLARNRKIDTLLYGNNQKARLVLRKNDTLMSGLFKTQDTILGVYFLSEKKVIYSLDYNRRNNIALVSIDDSSFRD